MGRHSAPDDAVAAARVATAGDAPRAGRHAAADEGAGRSRGAGRHPQRAGRSKAKRPVARGNHSTAEDIALLRERSDVRNRVIAAAVVPFVLYAAVLLSTGSVGVILIWAWIPFVTAGVLAGSIVDAAHRNRSRS
jgi:hypothetical protein